MLAEVEGQKLKQNWEREKTQADIVVTKAKAGADAIWLRGSAWVSKWGASWDQY